MPSKGRYTAGKQVSRYEADSDNIDIEYKNLDSQGQNQTPCTCPLGNKKPLVIKLLCLAVVFGLGLLLGFVVRKNVYTIGGLSGVPGHEVPSGKQNSAGIKQVRQLKS